jgi:hypothetical protein
MVAKAVKRVISNLYSASLRTGLKLALAGRSGVVPCWRGHQGMRLSYPLATLVDYDRCILRRSRGDDAAAAALRRALA